MKAADVFGWNVTLPFCLQLWHLLLLERPFTEGNTPDSEPRHPGGRLGGFSDLGGLGGLGGGPIGGSVPAGIGGSMGGLVGSMEHWGPGRHPRLHSQRRYRSRGSSRPDRSPAVEGWVTKTPRPPPMTSLRAPPLLLSTVFFFYLFCVCLSGSCSSFSPACSPTQECLVLLRSHGETTATSTSPRHSVLRLYRSLLSPPSGQGCCIPTRGTTPGVRGGWTLSSHRSVRLPSVQSTLFYSSYLLNLMSALHVSQLCLCSYLVSWKTQDPHRQKKRRSLPSPLSVYLRNKQVSHSVLSSLLVNLISPALHF